MKGKTRTDHLKSAISYVGPASIIAVPLTTILTYSFKDVPSEVISSITALIIIVLNLLIVFFKKYNKK